MSDKNIFTKLQSEVDNFDDTPLDYIYRDRSEAFEEIIVTRRSVRKFLNEPIPKEIVKKCLELALLAPNSSNLQPWEFLWIQDPDVRKTLAKFCFSQNAATTAADLIVCVARTDSWKRHCQEMIALVSSQGEVPKAVQLYYGKIAPFVYSLGPLNIFGFIKKIIYFFSGFFQVTPREMTNFSQLKTWAIKSCALGCENLMLAFRAFGFDTCPMEGFDTRKVKKLLKLNRHQHIVMIVAAGKRSEQGVYGPQLRFSSENFIKII